MNRTGLVFALVVAAATGLLFLAGARGLLLLGLALLVSGIASYVLLSRQRDRMSGALSSRLSGTRGRVTEFRRRLDAGARVEDVDDETPGPACYCGRTGCIETFLSGPGIAADHRRVTGESASAVAVVAAAARGDGAAEATLARYEDRLARGLASVINLVDPEIIVLGGGLSGIARLYESVPRLWPRYVFSDAVATRLVPPRHGDSSGVRGAAWLWRPEDLA